MTNLNNIQKIILLLGGATFFYFAIIRVPFHANDGNGIVYDSLFSARAKIDIARFSIILVVTSVLFIVLLLLFTNIKRNSRLHLKLSRSGVRKIGFFAGGLLLLTIGVFAFNKLSQSSKKADTLSPKAVEKKPEVTPWISIIDETKEKEELKPKYFTIKNRNFYSDEKFQDFISFTFHNNSSEPITNIMFKGKSFDKKTKKYKNNLLNKKIQLNTNDSTKFTFKIEYENFFVHKVRLTSGKSITFEEDPFSLPPDNLVYSDFLRNLVEQGLID